MPDNLTTADKAELFEAVLDNFSASEKLGSDVLLLRMKLAQLGISATEIDALVREHGK